MTAPKKTSIMSGGYGSPGYCKLCSFADPRVQDQFDKRVMDYNPRELNEWLAQRVEGFTKVARTTIYNHRQHVQSPKDRIVNAVEKRKKEHGYQPQRVTEDEFLESIIAMGHQNAMEDPRSVSVNHALKAVQVKRQASDKPTQNILVQLFTGHMPQDMVPVVEGEYAEV